MVHIHDEGGEFDAPIDVIWAYLETSHRGVHKSFRNLEVINISQNADLITLEEKIGGGWTKTTNRVFEFRPLGTSLEILTGPLAGTKQFTFYTPKGDRTGINIAGEFVSREIPEARLVSMVSDSLQELFDEDVMGLRAFVSKRK